jgi:quercetin 2,3-dioxygenase
MRRREFFVTALAALPALALGRPGLGWAATAQAFVVKAGASRFGIPTPFRGISPNDLKLSSKDTDGAVSTFDFIGLDRRGPSLHMHEAQDEAFYVVSGDYVFQLGEEKQRLGAGDVIFLPGRIKHSWVQMSDRGQMFYFLQPAGMMEEYFLRTMQLGENPDPAALARVRAECGITNLGPGLKASDPHVISETLSHGFIVRAGHGRLDERAMHDEVHALTTKVSGKDTGGALSVFECHGRSKGAQPLHVHPGQDEMAYVMQGGYRVQCGQDRYTLGVGDMIFLPRNVPHALAQLTDDGKTLSYFTPAGVTEDFFRALAGLPDRPSPDAAAAVYAKHGLKVVGPRPGD